jgi:hypothetical protein
MLGAELGEEGAMWELFGRDPVHFLQMSEGGALPVPGGFPNIPPEFVTRAKVKLLDDPGSDVDVVFPGGVGFLPTPDEARASRKDFQDAKGLFVRHASFTISRKEKEIRSWSKRGKMTMQAHGGLTHHWGPLEKRDHPGNLRSGQTARYWKSWVPISLRPPLCATDVSKQRDGTPPVHFEKREMSVVSEDENGGSKGFIGKVLLIAFPFLLLLIFLLLEGWIWGRP